jgi:hypothetical protein
MSQQPIGHKIWAVGDGYIPKWGHGPEPEMESHGSLGILNTSRETARIELTIYFNDREPAGPYRLSVEGRRTSHIRLNELEEPERIPSGKDFALVLESNHPVVVQHTRLDSRQSRNGLFSTVAFPAG